MAKKEKNILKGVSSPYQKVYHNVPYSEEEKIPDVYKAIDNDLARDNLENHLPAEDVQDI